MDYTAKDSKNFESHISNTLERVRTFDYFIQQIRSIVTDLGFSHYEFSLLSENNGVETLTNILPTQMVAVYFSEQLYKYDLLVEHVYDSKQPVFQSAVDKLLAHENFCDRIKKNLIIKELMNDYGFFDAFCLPVSIPDTNRKILFSVMSENTELNIFKRNVIEQRARLGHLAQSFYRIAIKNFPRKFPFKSLLTKRQTDVLQTVLNREAPMDEIAKDLNISISTLYRHIDNAKEAFGTTSTYKLLGMAQEKGLIVLEQKTH